MTAHTPAPWDVRPIRGVLDIAYTIATPGRDVAYVYGNAAHGKADARLIAAAPDLLAALDALVNSFETHRPKEYWDAARAAIARATGAA